MLQIVDAQWKDHLYSLDHLKEGIGLRGYGQRDPLVEYKKESFALFQAMKERDRRRDASATCGGCAGQRRGRRRPARRGSHRRAVPPQITMSAQQAPPPSPFGAIGSGSAAAPPEAPRPARTGGDDAPSRPVRRDEPKVGRNDPCPCGSGKKYKKCHGA